MFESPNVLFGLAGSRQRYELFCLCRLRGMHRIPIISYACLPPPCSGHLSKLVPASTALLTLFPAP